MGLRAPRIPFLGGVAILSGFAGIHPTDHVESFARAPYPLAADISVDGLLLSANVERVVLIEQAYDFSCGELRTRLRFESGPRRVEIDVLTFCSRTHPTIAAQEIAIGVDGACDISVLAGVDVVGLPGTWAARYLQPGPSTDGALRWTSHEQLSECGAAYSTELFGATEATRELEATEREWLSTTYAFRARAGRRYRLRQLTSLVQSSVHHEPDRQAIRLASAARKHGFDEIRDANRRAWQRLWRGRVQLIGAPRRWQALADAAVFYLHSSAHPSSPASTSMFGLSYWPNYHYYRGHVMWDIETFALPPLLLLEPASARALLDFRAKRLPAACQNAALSGFSGAQFPWESSMRYGDEATPDEGDASAVEHHVSIDVAHAFAQYVHATGDLDYASRRAWPVISAVANWIESRTTETGRGYEIQRVTGIAEKERPENNSAFTNIGAIVVLREALALAERLGTHPAPSWSEIARRLVVPLDRRSSIIRNYDGHRASDEKGETPDAAAALLLFGYDTPPKVETATYRRAIELADAYVGSPMLSALLGVFAARIGEREQALDLFERGYAEFALDPFDAPDEYSSKVFPEKARAAPFAANLGGFLLGLLYGLTGVRLGPGAPDAWCANRPLMPAGWRAIEVERIWVRGKPARLLAVHGKERASIEFD